jgi:hypothetical protein
MMLKYGKEEIKYLLKKVFEKYEQETGNELILNTNRKNYEDIAKILSQISNNLPFTQLELDHEEYPKDANSNKLEYPYLKYDITGGQVKDAFNGLVAKPRNFLVDACYIYVFGVGRKGFEKNILDPNLIASEKTTKKKLILKKLTTKKQFYVLLILLSFMVFFLVKWINSEQKLSSLKKDLVINPYQPTQAQIDSLEGVWMVYIGSPQSRKSDKDRYHKIVRNIINIKYKDGYFLFNRYGAGFDHFGYMQFENKDVISIHSYLKNTENNIESPRLSLLRIDKNSNKQMVISASWNFDIGENNDIIGIREVYIKQGKGGEIQEVINTVENTACKCKILRWKIGDVTKTFFLRNELLDSIQDASLKNLIDENSILLRMPDSVTVIKSIK